MKRVLNQALSFFSPVKKARREEETPTAKRAPRPSLADTYAHLDAIERLQSRLLTVDKECLTEQLEVQRKHDLRKIPLQEQRKEEISKIPDFWVTAIGNHPFTNQEPWPRDREILSYLESIDLEDNLDDNGSYNLTFKFGSGNPFFSNSELVRSVTILEDQSDVVTSTPILWAPKRKPPPHSKSFFAWFSSPGGVALEEDFGEILRRDLWQNPYPYYLNLAPHSGPLPRPDPGDDNSVEDQLVAPDSQEHDNI
jgi:template-activating factor I